MKYDLIALDLDGTALNPQNTVNPAVQKAIAWARAQGVYVVISTGRICGEAAEFARMLGTDDMMVTSGGASLSLASENRCIMRLSMPWELAVQVAAVVERAGMTSMIYAGEKLLITPYEDMMVGQYQTNEGFLANRQVVSSVTEYIAQQHLSVDKIFSRTDDPVILQQARRKMEALPAVRVVSSANDNMEISSQLADKGRALDALCRHLGTTLERCIAIGDSENDVEMMQAVGMPVAMGNATKQIKKLARYITATNEQDGVAQAIYHLLGASA